MNAQTKNSSSCPCSWCGSPAGRLHLAVTGPRIVFGVPRHWRFCGLLCLQAWAASERLPNPNPTPSGVDEAYEHIWSRYFPSPVTPLERAGVAA